MHKRKTHEEFVSELSLLDDKILVLGQYITSRDNIAVSCKVCHYNWKATPTNLLRGRGCPRCANKRSAHMRRKSEVLLDKQLADKNILRLSEYINGATHITVKCGTCDHVWKATPNNLCQGKSCPKCAIKHNADKLRKTHTKFINDVYNINPDISILEEYINHYTKIKFKHNLCGHTWMAKPNNILSGKSCPRCNESCGEKYISRWLNKHHMLFERQRRFDGCKHINALSFDFYIPVLNLCIEFQGEQHYNPIKIFGGEDQLNIQKKLDNIKRVFCNENNIKLLEIRFDDNIDARLNELSLDN